jgi:molybdopterin-binding protein
MEQNMFETCVKQIVTITLNKPVTTEFFNGTLFVSTITEDQARRVFHALSKSLGLGKVQVSPIGDTGEFAYDFV